MPTQAHVGLSSSDDSRQAGTEAAKAALAGLGGPQADLALVFATSEHQHDVLLQAIRAVLPSARLLGCSGEGVIAHDESLEASSAVAVMAIASTGMTFDTFVVEEYAQSPADAGHKLARMVKEKVRDPQCVCLLSDGLLGNATDFLAALHADMGHVPIVGGTAADGMTFEQTFQYDGTRVLSGGLVAFTISGAADVEIAGADVPVVLKVEGGALPLTWLADGAPLGLDGNAREIEWTPEGRGFVRLSVIDAKGRVDTGLGPDPTIAQLETKMDWNGHVRGRLAALALNALSVCKPA